MRCTDRAVACGFGAAAPPHQAEVSDESGTVDTAARQQAGDLVMSRYQGHCERTATADTSLAPLGRFDADSVAAWHHNSPELSLSSQYPIVDGDINVHGLVDVVLHEPGAGHHGPDTRLSPSWSHLASGTLPFGRRAFPRPHQGALAALAVQIICSYPSMLLRKATLPPFMSPVVFEWARSGSTLRLQVRSPSISNSNRLWSSAGCILF